MMEILQEQFDSLLEKGALEPVPPSPCIGFFSRIFVIPKKSGEFLFQLVHIRGKMNVIAFFLSCQDQTTEWSLNPEVTRHIFHYVDLFATRWNARLPTFVSSVPDPQALGVDALSLPWQDL